MIIAAIDPGISGAIAILDKFGVYQCHMHMPIIKLGKQKRVNGAAVSAYLRDNHVQLCYIEHVHSMPKQGVASTFTFGHAAGLIEGVVTGLSIPLTLMPPTRWKKHMGVSGKDKDVTRSRAVQLYPDIRDLDLKGKGQALADAIFIGLCGLNLTEPRGSLL